MGRAHSAKRKATERTDGGATVDGSHSALTRLAVSSGPSMVQLQAERIAQGRFTEMMAAAGVPHSRMALENLYFLPRGLLDTYAEMTLEALEGTDGGSAAKGRTGDATAALGRASGKATKSTQGRAARNTGKKYKKFWVVRNEDAFLLKDRIDKRLRSLERDMRAELEEIYAHAEQGKRHEAAKAGNGARTKAVGIRCGECGIIASATWNFCAHCGAGMTDGSNA